MKITAVKNKSTNSSCLLHVFFFFNISPTSPFTIFYPQNPWIFIQFRNVVRRILKLQNWERARRVVLFFFDCSQMSFLIRAAVAFPVGNRILDLLIISDGTWRKKSQPSPQRRPRGFIYCGRLNGRMHDHNWSYLHVCLLAKTLKRVVPSKRYSEICGSIQLTSKRVLFPTQNIKRNHILICLAFKSGLYHEMNDHHFLPATRKIFFFSFQISCIPTLVREATDKTGFRAMFKN